jgi:hypothetical protein
VTAATVFELLSEEIPAFAGLRHSTISPFGAPIQRPGAPPANGPNASGGERAGV